MISTLIFKNNNNMYKLTLTIATVFIIIISQAQQPMLDKKGQLVSMDDVDLFSMVQPIPTKNIFSDSIYNIWCGSVIKGKNGKYYMLYSRWPRANGHFAWVPSSEIALAKSDKPEGPYKHVKVVFKPRGNKYWDGVCTHNPAVIEYNGKYYLFYMGTTGTSTVKQPASMDDNNWWEYRNNQRIGVAIADDLEGEWKRFDQPVLDVSKDSTAFDALMVSNPAITVDQNGKAILVYKQVAKSNNTNRGGKVRFGVAFANSLLGPFTKQSEPIFQAKQKDNNKVWMIAEDPYIWNYKGSIYAIVTDVVGFFTNNEAALALLSSKDGINWEPTHFPKVIPHRLKFADGKIADDKLERPCLYTEKGVPKFLFGALGFNNRNYSVNVAVPLK
jgi:predicted GH43/DUF377 family glycosyl hydrolase